MSIPFPFTAIVGQDEMKQAILLAAVDPTIGGVLVFGDRGTGKSTAVRALASLLPPMRVVVGCHYGCAGRRVHRLPRPPRARRQAQERHGAGGALARTGSEPPWHVNSASAHAPWRGASSRPARPTSHAATDLRA